MRIRSRTWAILFCLLISFSIEKRLSGEMDDSVEYGKLITALDGQRNEIDIKLWEGMGSEAEKLNSHKSCPDLMYEDSMSGGPKLEDLVIQSEELFGSHPPDIRWLKQLLISKLDEEYRKEKKSANDPDIKNFRLKKIADYESDIELDKIPRFALFSRSMEGTLVLNIGFQDLSIELPEVYVDPLPMAPVPYESHPRDYNEYDEDSNADN